MKITEMNNCIEEMRKCYKFEDEKNGNKTWQYAKRWL